MTPEQRAKLRLYLVSPEGWGAHPNDETRLAMLIEAGVGTVQFREKNMHADRRARAQRMRDIAQAHGALFLVNDDPMLARELDADGVHVGVDDARVQDARALLGPNKIIGATAKTTTRAQQAIQQGADYLGVGALFDARASKPDAEYLGLEGFRALRNQKGLQNVPMIAIGGITIDTAPLCFDAGADGVAMIRGLWSIDHPKHLLKRLRSTPSSSK